jgi:hypothetical protein
MLHKKERTHEIRELRGVRYKCSIKHGEGAWLDGGDR